MADSKAPHDTVNDMCNKMSVEHFTLTIPDRVRNVRAVIWWNSTKPFISQMFQLCNTVHRYRG